MKMTNAVCAALLVAAASFGGAALADPRCPPRPPDVALDSKEGYSQGYAVNRCYVDRPEVDRRYRDRDRHLEREVDRRYRDRDRYLEREVDRRYRDRDRYLEREVDRRYRDRDRFERRADRYRDRNRDFERFVDRDEYDRRYRRRDDGGEVVDFATDLLRGALSN
jgi:hypothetical protein